MLTLVLSIVAVVVGGMLALWLVALTMLRDVPPGQIRLVTWFQGRTHVYRGPAKSREFPVLSTAMTIPCMPINAALDLVDQTLDTVAVQAAVTALVSVGDPGAMVHAAATVSSTKGLDVNAKSIVNLP